MRYRTTLGLILLGLVFGIAGAAHFKGAHKTKAPWMPVPVGKHLALLKVEIATPESVPEAGNDEVTLKGRILVNRNLQGNLTYSWNLPEDVQAVEGAISESLANVKMGQVIEVAITVSGFNKEKQRLISLQTSGHLGNELLGNSAVVASRLEDTWEAVAPEMKKAAEEQLGSESKSHRSQ